MKVNIIGAGITGLSAANFLTRKGHDVRIFDQSSEVGGLAGFFPVEGTYLEKYYHHIFAGHHELIALIKDLGLGNDLIFQNAKMGLYCEDRLYPFASAKDLLSLSPLRLRDRLRLGLSSLMMMQIKDWQTMEKRSALEWLHTYSGRESCRVVWEPLLKMKFGDDYDQISAAWLWNRVVDRKKSKGQDGRKEVLGYIRGGYKKLFDALLKEIKRNGGQLHTEMPVHEIIVKNGVGSGVTTKERAFESDAILATVPIPSFLSMAASLPESYVKRLSSINYQGSVCVVLKLRKGLSRYYWINVSDSDSPFVGIIEHTSFITPENYGNRHLIYLTKYSSSNASIFSESDEDILRDFVAHLGKVFPEFQEGDVEQYWVFKDRFSQPVFVRDYSKIMPETSTPIKNLYLLNSSQTYPQSRCLNSSIEMAKDTVKEMLLHHGQ